MAQTQSLPECECTAMPPHCDCDGTCERESDGEVMTNDGAKWLCDQCAENADYERWSALDSKLREALVSWYTANPSYTIGSSYDSDYGEDSGLSNRDRRLLLKLVEANLFWTWKCPRCEGRCTHGEPEDWSEFQGAAGDCPDNQDHDSYPGDPKMFTTRAIAAMCNACRHCPYLKMPADGTYPFPVQ